MNNTTPLYVTIGSVAIALVLTVMCSGIIDARHQEEKRKNDLLQREPWRKYERDPYRYDPNYRGRH